MSNILILSAGRRVELVQAFKTEMGLRGGSGCIFAADMRPELSAACQVADGAIRLPRCTEGSYINELLLVCKTEKIGLVVPTIDTELLLLAEHRPAFKSHGIEVVISDLGLIQQCRDKRLTVRLFESLDIDSPKVLERHNLKFPCFVKPYDGSCSKGAAALLTEEALSETMLSDSKLMFMELVNDSYVEYTIDAYYDKGGCLKCFVPRQRIETRAGEVSKGVTRRDFVYEYLKDRLNNLKGAVGCITLQLFANPTTNKILGLEINPRFGGGFPLAYSAGANFPGWLIDEYLFGKGVVFNDDWDANLLMLRYDAKVLIHDAP